MKILVFLRFPVDLWTPVGLWNLKYLYRIMFFGQIRAKASRIHSEFCPKEPWPPILSQVVFSHHLYTRLLLKAGWYSRGSLSFTVPQGSTGNPRKTCIFIDFWFFWFLWILMCLINLLVFWFQSRIFWIFLRKTVQNHYEITSKSQFWFRNVGNLTKSRVSGVWFLSPEAGGTLRAVPGDPWRAAASKELLRSCIRTL